MDCNNIKKVKIFRFKHKGIWRQFTCNTTVDECFGTFDTTEKPREVILEFDDLSELNTLIWALDRFRIDCKDSIGIWEYKYDETL